MKKEAIILTQEDQERIESIQQYMKAEVTQEKNPWLSSRDVEELMTLTQNNPYKALRQWQYICEDTSFKPLTKAEALLREQKIQSEQNNLPPKETLQIREEREKMESIRQYMKAEVTQERHPWLDKKDVSELLELADKNPYGALKAWERITDDKSFVPMTNAKTEELLQKANELTNQVSFFLPAHVVDELKKSVASHPQGIIETCQSLLKEYPINPTDKAIYEHRQLCEQYSRGSESVTSQQRESIEKRMHEIARDYGKDQRFLEYVERIDNKQIKQIAKEPLEIKQEKQEIERHNFSHKF